MNFIKVNVCESVEKYIEEFLQCFPHFLDKVDNISDIAKKWVGNAEIYIISDDSSTIGISVFYANDLKNKCGYISLIGIKEKYRKKKMGTKLLLYTHQIMKQKGMNKCKLEVDKDNYNAYSFYINNGYEYYSSATDTSDYLICRI